MDKQTETPGYFCMAYGGLVFVLISAAVLIAGIVAMPFYLIGRAAYMFSTRLRKWIASEDTENAENATEDDLRNLGYMEAVAKLDSRVEALKKTIAELEKENMALAEEAGRVANLNYTISTLREKIDELQRSHDVLMADAGAKTTTDEVLARLNAQKVWYWQGEGHDVPESIDCPVIVHPAVLRKLIARESSELVTVRRQLKDVLQTLEKKVTNLSEAADLAGYWAAAMRESLKGCPACEYDEAEGDLFDHCKLCQLRVTQMAWSCFANEPAARISRDWQSSPLRCVHCATCGTIYRAMDVKDGLLPEHHFPGTNTKCDGSVVPIESETKDKKEDAK